jgi:hypothetical protein
MFKNGIEQKIEYTLVFLLKFGQFEDVGIILFL